MVTLKVVAVAAAGYALSTNKVDASSEVRRQLGYGFFQSVLHVC